MQADNWFRTKAIGHKNIWYAFVRKSSQMSAFKTSIKFKFLVDIAAPPPFL